MLDTTRPLVPGEVFEEVRPWGKFRTVLNGTFFKVKTLHINPASRLSLQSHRFRSEHWILVAGTVSATVGNQDFTMQSGDHMLVPIGTLHRLHNTSPTEPAVIVEVQQGMQLTEDDIERYDDDYGRGLVALEG
jgi:mannose-6-phosphate isomerase-like protein (cupin superfamily)